MKTKNYWWRLVVTAIAMGILLIAYIGPCDFRLSRCLGGDSIYMVRTIFHIFLAILIISPFLFFINDKIFLKWLRFAGVWIVLSILAIIITPSHSEGILSFGGPSKELVSIWMGVLFVILSLTKITLAYRSKK